MPLVVMLPPFKAVVPPALVVKLLAVSAALIVVVLVLFKVTAPKAFVPPTIPVKVILPEPAFTVKLRAVVSKLSRVEAKTTALFVVAKVVFAFKVTALLYVCVPVVETEAPFKFVVVSLSVKLRIGVPPITPLNVIVPAPLKFKLPKPLLLPLIAPKVTVPAEFVTFRVLPEFNVPVPLKVRLFALLIAGVALAANVKSLARVVVKDALKVPPFKFNVPVPRAFVATPIRKVPLVKVVLPV